MLLFFDATKCNIEGAIVLHNKTNMYLETVLRHYMLIKFESLFYKNNTCLEKTTTCIGLQEEQIFSVYIQCTYFSILGVAFTIPFLCYIQKLQPRVVKKFWTNFCCIVLLYLWAQKVCLRFLKSYFKLEMLIFCPSLCLF